MLLVGVIILIQSLKASCVRVDVAPTVQINYSKDKEMALEYLDKYGYSNKGVTILGDEIDMIKKFQEDAGLSQTGELDAPTMEIMAAPRCGLGAADYQTSGDQQKWKKKELSYKVTSYSQRMSDSAVDRIVRQAMDFWEEVTDLRFYRSSANNVDIEIKFKRREHGDGISFDGEGGVLAHAYYPGPFGDMAGDVHFDDAEYWSEREYLGKQLLQTCTHELGHSLGLGHSRVRESVMYFAYPGWNPHLKLHQDDITRIQNLYPKPQSPENDCTCQSFTRYNPHRNQYEGNCQAAFQGRKWCYIQRGAICSDSKKSAHVGYYWSWDACQHRKPRNNGGDRCVTAGGGETGATCVFPFTFGDKTLRECTLDGADDGIHWCSTLVDDEGVHVGGKGKWGHCAEGCPGLPSKSMESSTHATSTLDPATVTSSGPCECTGDTRFNTRLNQYVGFCQTRYKGNFWCYISPNSSCSDKDETGRDENKFRYWSALACSPLQVDHKNVENEP